MVEKKGFPGWLKWTIIVITVALIVFDPFGDARYRAGVRVNVDLHRISY